MRTGLIAQKVGMTQMFKENGVHVPITVLKIHPCKVVVKKTKEKDGYDALQLGCIEVSPRKVSKPLQGYFAKKELNPLKKLKEFRVNPEDEKKVNDVIEVDHFKIGQYVDVTGTSVGKGFAGVMKRHNFGGLRATHGVSVSHRSHGSTGNRQDPGKVFKNKKMAGHMGCRRVTKMNLFVYSIDANKGLLFIKGSVPGHKNGFVYVRDAIKKLRVADEN